MPLLKALDARQIRIMLSGLLATDLGTYKVPNNTLIPAIWVGDTPPGYIATGLECNIQRTPERSFRGGLFSKRIHHMSQLVWVIRLKEWTVNKDVSETVLRKFESTFRLQTMVSMVATQDSYAQTIVKFHYNQLFAVGE